MADDLRRIANALEDRYGIERKLGSGGMATVYLAEDRKHRRKVAIKVLRPELAATLGPERFLREVDIAAQLQHPHVLPLLDSGEAEGFLYYVMPYVEGPSLRRKLMAEGELPIGDAVRVLRDVADALAYAHARGVIHRDIKPDNVMISGRHALVTDFGVAKALDEATGVERLTTTGDALGTPAYMAPEQAVADVHVDQRADIYAFGVMAYELLTGRPPFLAATAQDVVSAHLTTAPDPVTKHREAVPPALGQLVMRCLEKKPADRWQRADELVEALEALSTPSFGVTPSGRPFVPGRTAWRRWILAAAAPLVVGAVAMLAVFRSPGGALPPENAFAVTPFDVLGSGPPTLARDIAELMQHRLDGAGPLTGVPRAAVDKWWTGPADRDAALRLGGAVSAGLVVFGRIAVTSPDSMHITATLLDVARDAPLADYEATTPLEAWYEAANALSVWALETVTRSRRIAAVPLKSIGSTSPTAIKAFITGEGYYRRSSYDSARLFYTQALAADSTFALAHSRLGTSKWNVGVDGWTNDMIRAGQLNHGLAQRESLVVAWDSLYAAFFGAFIGDSASWSRSRRLATTSERLVRLYPLDVEAWYLTGEWRYHSGPYVGVSDREAWQAFAQAVRLDPGFGESLDHLALLTLHLDGPDSARRVLEQALAVRRGAAAEGDSLALAMLDPALAPRPSIDERLATVSSDALRFAAYFLKEWPDSAEAAVAMIRTLDARAPDLRLVWTLGVRGHLAETRRLVSARHDWGGEESWLLPTMALLGAFPADSADRIFRSRLVADPAGNGSGIEWWYSTLPWWLARRDTAAIERVMALCNSAVARGNQRFPAFVDYINRSASAYLAVARGDTTAAIARLARLPTWPQQLAFHEWLLYARLLRRTGRLEEANRLLERPPYPHDWILTPERVVAELERGLVNEELGNRQQAIDAYSYVVNMWRHADSALQINYVEPARERLRRLTAEQVPLPGP